MAFLLVATLSVSMTVMGFAEEQGVNTVDTALGQSGIGTDETATYYWRDDAIINRDLSNGAVVITKGSGDTTITGTWDSTKSFAPSEEGGWGMNPMAAILIEQGYTGTITLDNINIDMRNNNTVYTPTSPLNFFYGIVLYGDCDVKFQLVGSNKITAILADEQGAGIMSYWSNVKIEGDGNLDIASSHEGIYVSGANLTINADLTVDASYKQKFKILFCRDIGIALYNGDLIINGGTVVTKSGGRSGEEFSGSPGLRASNVVVNGGSLTAIGGDGEIGGVGISAEKIIANAPINATGGNGENGANGGDGIDRNGESPATLTIANGVTVNANGGIYNGKGVSENITVINNGGILNAIDGEKSPISIDPTPPTTPDAPTAPFSTSNVSSSDRGSSTRDSYAQDNTTTKTNNAPVAVASSTATELVKTAVKLANSGTATIRVKNAGDISSDTFKAMVKAAGSTPIKFNADSMSTDSKRVEVRITVAPAKATKGINLYASTTSPRAKSTEASFEKHYTNNVSVISLTQQGDFGTAVEISAKIDSKLNTKTLLFYSYDKASNSFKPITTPNYFVDQNGYVHFTTTQAGDIVVTDKILANK